MNEYAVLVQPIDYPLSQDNMEICYNCGGNIFRVMYTWCAIKEKFEGKFLLRSAVDDINFYCAICGINSSGIAPSYGKQVIQGDFATREEAEFFLDNYMKDEAEK